LEHEEVILGFGVLGNGIGVDDVREELLRGIGWDYSYQVTLK
jgi:hypothetical protein